MDNGCHLLFRVKKKHRITVGHQNPDHDAWLVGDYCVTLHGKEVRKIRVGLIDGQYISAVYLLDGEKLVGLKAESPNQSGTVSFHVVPCIVGIVAKVQGIVRGAAHPAVAGGKAGINRCILSPARLQVADFSLSYEFHG
jgi:hypothetical protein